MGDFSERVFAVVQQIPRGRVATYGQVGCLCLLYTSSIGSSTSSGMEAIPECISADSTPVERV